MDNFERVKRFIDMNPQLSSSRSGIPVSETMVLQLEKELDIKFRGEYLRFIQLWGSISMVGSWHEYFAIYPFQGRAFYWVTDEAQHLWTTGLPRSYIP